MHYLRFLAFGMLLATGVLAAAPAQAQTDRRCFDAPGITSCIEGRFREYWEQNGGLPVFGYPITAATTEKTAEGSFLTQYFERNRFELHPEKARPYDVLLGRLGDDRLEQQGRDWRAFGPAKKIAGCLFFAETNHNICDLSGGAGFKTYWEGHGLQDPALDRFQRSLALFGLPLSEVTVETNAAGDTVLTQWFERARFEYHLDQPREFQVLLGLLGNETRNPPATSTRPLPTPQPVQPRLCDGIPGPQGAIAVPDCVKAGHKVLVSALGFAPDEAINYRVATAAGAAIGGEQTARANQFGNARIEIDTGRYAGGVLRPGDYILVAQSASGRATRVGFRVRA